MPDVSGRPFMLFLTQYGFLIFLVNFGLSFIGAAMAKKSGYSYGGFLCLGMFTSFVISIIVAACIKPKPGSNYFGKPVVFAQPGISCGQCGTVCSISMVYCPKCGRKIKGECKSCGGECSDDMAFCPTCGKEVSEEW